MAGTISERNLVRYACVAHLPSGTTSESDDPDPSTMTVLASFNTGDASLQELAQECILRTPTNHSIFNHNIRGCAYTFLIEDPFVFFSISDERFPKSDLIWLLARMRDALKDLIRKRSTNWRKKPDPRLKQRGGFSSYCFQGDFATVFSQLFPKSGDSENPNGDDGSKVNGGVENQSPYNVDSERKTWGIPLFSKNKKKKKIVVESTRNSRDLLVKGGAELSDHHGVEISSREVITVSPQKGGVGDLDDDELSKEEKAKKWRFFVWVVLVLDLALCLILFGIWLVVCHGFSCLNR